MNDQDPTIQADELPSAVSAAAEQAGASIAALTSIGAQDVFREPVQSGDRVVITAAVVTRGGGFGFGGGFGLDREQPGTAGYEGGGGAGGGGGGEGRPVAVIEITPEGTSVKPVLDFTKLGLTLLAGIFGIWRATRSRRSR